MTRAAPLALALLLAAACDGLPGRPVPTERYRRPGDVLDFATLYDTNCAGCHGAAGQLGPARPLADPLYLALVGRERLRAIVALGVPGTAMPTFLDANGGTLTAAQVDALADGVFESWARPVPVALPSYAASAPGDAARGHDAFATWCAECHGDDGLGGEKGGAVLDPDFLALASDQMLRTTVLAGRPDLDMPSWRDASRERPMSERDVADVVAFMIERRR